MKMIEALCGLKSDWAEGLPLEKSYRFKGDAMPRDFFWRVTAMDMQD